jgi:hypothetical protein
MPLVSIFTAPLLAVYGAMEGRPSSLWTEQTLMILPRLRAINGAGGRLADEE